MLGWSELLSVSNARLTLTYCFDSRFSIFILILTGSAKSADFDVSLMICLIRNLTPIQVSDVLPFEMNTTTGADLSRVKYYRNMFCHNKNQALSDENFEEYWTDLAEVRFLKNFDIMICVYSVYRNISQDTKDSYHNSGSI